jgi:hypothetical protein
MEKSKLEKFAITFSLQLEKGINELLAELFHEEKYNGYAEISWEVKSGKKETQLKLNLKKMDYFPINKKPHCFYYHIVQDKGVKKL